MQQQPFGSSKGRSATRKPVTSGGCCGSQTQNRLIKEYTVNFIWVPIKISSIFLNYGIFWARCLSVEGRSFGKTPEPQSVIGLGYPPAFQRMVSIYMGDTHPTIMVPPTTETLRSTMYPEAITL